MKRFSFLRSRVVRYGAIGIIAILCLWNANSLVTGQIGTMFIPREIHEEYFRYREWLNEQDEYFRVLAVPTASKWMVYTNKHPKANLVDLTRGKWNTFSLPAVNGHPERQERMFLSPLEQSFSDTLLDRSAIRYVVVPRDDTENADDFFELYGSRDVFLARLDTLPYLSRIDVGTGEIIVYENFEARPHWYNAKIEETMKNIENISILPIDAEMISPSEYYLQLRENSHREELWRYVYFSEAYHPDWDLFLGEFSWKKVFFQNKKDGIVVQHKETDTGLNEFLLSEDAAKQFANGEPITAFFRPQAYLYGGLVISCFVFAISSLFLIISFWKFHKNRAILKKR